MIVILIGVLSKVLFKFVKRIETQKSKVTCQRYKNTHATYIFPYELPKKKKKNYLEAIG